LYESMIDPGHMSSERRESARSALPMRVLFWLLAVLAICATPLGAGNGWASAPELARALAAAELRHLPKVESDKSFVEASKLLSFASTTEAGDDALVVPPQVFPRAGDGRDHGHARPLPEALPQRTRSFDSQAPPVRPSFA
jgi:hypothetical protein